ncbi:MAG: hypothetical protein KKF80_06040, partial [Candidatus Omnitrophica bacterium]|nr:hypothetical protein [Candidatus Omnitrophota bacterium]
MKRTIITLLGILIMETIALGTSGTVRAETIILKSGKTVQGKVIEKTTDYVRFDFAGVELKYYLDEIASIDTEPIRTEAQTITKEIPDIPVSTTRKEIFENEECGFSLAYPQRWQLIPSENLKKVMIAGFTPRETSAVTVQIQAGRYSHEDIRGKTTLADLIDGSLKPAPDLKKEVVKPVTLRFETGYLVRYSYKTVEAIYDKNIEGPLYIPIKIIFDYYFFSPAFTSQGRDQRSFLI